MLVIAAAVSTTEFVMGGSLAPTPERAARGAGAVAATAPPAMPARGTVGTSAAGPLVVEPAPVVLPPAVLRTGSKGAGAADLERRLRDLGFQARTASGTFDSETRHAVVAFQKLHGLDRTGVFDAATREALAAPQAAVARVGGERLHMEVDLAHQVAFVVQDGDVTNIYDASTGRAGWETPTGGSRSSGGSTAGGTGGWAPMYRPAYFTKEGVAFHGGGPAPTKAASHGCIRITDPSINEIFSRLRRHPGGGVLIHAGPP